MAKALKNAKARVKPHGHDLDPAKQKDHNDVTPKEELFCQGYVLHFNVREASRIADIAYTTGQQWMTKENIKKRVFQIRTDVGKTLDMTKEALLQRLAQIIHGNPKKLFKDGKLIHPDKWDDETAAMVQGITFKMNQLEGIKSHDPLRAIEIINKMLGYNAPEVTKLDLSPINYDKKELLDIAKMMEGLI